jgi:hypothetical protein
MEGGFIIEIGLFEVFINVAKARGFEKFWPVGWDLICV